MDGILSGLTSIVTIIPDQSTIADRSGTNGPPVEIMPLPTNSFKSEDNAAELLNNPFTLSLDKDGHGNGSAGGGKAVDSAAPQTGRTAAETLMTGGMLEEAYTLSLGNEENAPGAAEIAREMSRMKNYETLGKSATRRTYVKNTGTDNALYNAAQTQDVGSTEQIGENIRSLLSRFAAEPHEAGAQITAQNRMAETISKTQDAYLLPPETRPDAIVSTRQASQTGRTPAMTIDRQDLSLLSNLSGLQLSASDIEAILTLEPEFRDALLSMLSEINTNISGEPAAEMPEGQSYDAGADERAARTNTQIGPGAEAETNLGAMQPQQGAVRQTLNGMTGREDAAEMRQITSTPDDMRAALLSIEEQIRLTAEAAVGGRAVGASQTAALRGSMENLRKVNELPYSLYIFGNVSAERKDEPEDDAVIDASLEQETEKKRPGGLLRLSEAIKMASVLHNIYFGGSGRFPEDTPWYTPYVRYAIKNGIIQSGEFGDFNGYATRAETAYIFASCVPRAEYPIINYISDIPDVSENIGYGDSIYLLHRAGVLIKSDKKSSYYPESLITKTEAAAIIGRIATPSDRKRILNI